MAKPNYRFQKKQREEQARQKREQKLLERTSRKEQSLADAPATQIPDGKSDSGA